MFNSTLKFLYVNTLHIECVIYITTHHVAFLYNLNMSESQQSNSRASKLPEVGDDILSQVLYEEITQDPEGIERWRRFRTTNPSLAHNVWLRAQRESGNDPRMVKIALDTVSVAIAGLEIALDRQSEPASTHPMIGQLALFEEKNASA